jgi:hypothetical protein
MAVDAVGEDDEQEEVEDEEWSTCSEDEGIDDEDATAMDS